MGLVLFVMRNGVGRNHPRGRPVDERRSANPGHGSPSWPVFVRGVRQGWCRPLPVCRRGRGFFGDGKELERGNSAGALGARGPGERRSSIVPIDRESSARAGARRVGESEVHPLHRIDEARPIDEVRPVGGGHP